MALAIIVAVLLLIGLLLFLDYKFGRKKHLSAINRKNYPIRESNFEIFTGGPELFEDLFSELRKAEKHIHILFYIVKDDPVSKEFLSILKERAKNGVEVRLLLDWLGSFSVKNSIVKELKDDGVKFAFCHVLKFPFLFYSSQVRNHRKITVIDGKMGYIGGFNIGKEYINMDPKLCPWRDYHLKIMGEGVHDLQREFLKDWREERKENLLQDSIYFPMLPKGQSRHQIIPSEGFYLEETFSGLIRKAEKSIMIGTPYFIPSTKILKDLLDALDRGVHITLLVPYKSDHALVQEASHPYLREILKKGADVHQYLKGFYHAKVLFIDDNICDIGTANFDKRSLFLNHEINCYIFDKNLIDKLKAVIEKDILDSKVLTLEELNRFKLSTSIKEAIARPISHFL
ncbi:cardiolipin synthase [Bacillus sp. 31A1R]|uniref:Cardiolipin synthase n=1 Tax=Robertmurraya mangrovi TaxID=3098077 RepID=A0ABU5IX83_9BACI|nr:cardiolipin synthase [Bacillus sp. 31A1R]MDZ5471773.1 cardiolipin synthase [Bacillus sp. 31A1R]